MDKWRKPVIDTFAAQREKGLKKISLYVQL